MATAQTAAKSKKGDSQTSGALLEAKGLWKEYEGPNGKLKILKGVDLAVEKGEMVFILGRSGSGKSTLMHILGGLDSPSKGSVFFKGTDISAFRERRLCEYRNQNVGFVFQFYHLLPELTLFENVLLPGMMRGQTKERRARDVLARVGLSDRRDHYPAQLSGGEQQRAAIARALANDADLILCDEPTGNLDEETAGSVFDLLIRLNREDEKTFLIVTHEVDLIKKDKTVYHLHDGVLDEGMG